MKKTFLAFFTFATFLQAMEPTSDLLKPQKTNDTISYFMLGAAAPIHKDAMDVISPNFSYGMRHFSGIHAKDYFITGQGNEKMQSIAGQYSFLFFPITMQGFAKTHSSVYIGAGFSAGVTYLSQDLAQKERNWENEAEIKRQIKAQNVTNPDKMKEIRDIVEKNQSLNRITPALDIPLIVGYQFANTNFIQMQFSTLAFARNRYYDLPGNGIYGSINYGFGF